MKLYDTLTTDFKTVGVEKVCMYNCGPTVYDYIHIGNARPLILADIIVRNFEDSGIEYDYLLNITDIDDKIINRAAELNIPEEELSQKFTKAFLEDVKTLNVKTPTSIIPISLKVNEMLDFINELVEKGFAYEVSGNVYFDIGQWPNEYGNISKQNIDQLNVGNRIEEDLNKKNPQDFVLWKKTNEGKQWPSKWSLGRPGWHTECALLIDNYFYTTIDLHLGGVDLKFPHHENERIQYLAKNAKELSKVWLHNGHISIENAKMSKSLNNTILVKDFIKDYSANALRFIFLNSNYRQPLNINNQLIQQSVEWVEKIQNLLRTINWSKSIGDITLNDEIPTDQKLNPYKYITKFKEYIQDDLNTPLIISLLEEMYKNINKQLKNKVISLEYSELLKLLNILGFSFIVPDLEQLEIDMIKKWRKLIKDKRFEEADAIREILKQRKII